MHAEHPKLKLLPTNVTNVALQYQANKIIQPSYHQTCPKTFSLQATLLGVLPENVADIPHKLLDVAILIVTAYFPYKQLLDA